MIVVAIIGLLAAIAYPSYTDNVRKGRRTDATASLTDAAQRMERCYISSNTYTGCAPASYESPEGFYDISFATTATTYLITATAKGAQSSDNKCDTFTLSNTGLQGSTGSATAAICWGG